MKNSVNNPLSISHILQKRVELVNCEQSTKNLQNLCKSEGVIFLDAHQARVFIFASASAIYNNFLLGKLLLPMGAYDYYAPLINQIVSTFSNNKGFSIHPVVRSEDKNKHSRGIIWRKIHSKWVKPNFENNTNEKYLKTLLLTLSSSNSGVLLSPYGGVKPFGSEVKSGVAKLLTIGKPIVFVYSKLDWIKMKFNVALSNPFCFPTNESKENIQNTIHNNFICLQNQFIN